MYSSQCIYVVLSVYTVTYGITTGFGKFANIVISKEKTRLVFFPFCFLYVCVYQVILKMSVSLVIM